MKAIIPAAGFGTRFLPVTKVQPKEMLPVLDKPIIQYVVEEAVAGGADQVLLVTGRSKRSIEDHFDSSPELEASLTASGKTSEVEMIQSISRLADVFSVRQSNPKGLGHAVLCGAPFTGSEPFYVLLGDVMVPENNILPRMHEIYEQTGASVIAVEAVPIDEVHKYGVVGYENDEAGRMRITEMVEKPATSEAPSNLAILGRYLLTPAVMEILATTPPGRGGEIQLTDALVALLDRERVYALEVDPSEGFDTGNVMAWLETNLAVGMKDERYGDTVKDMVKRLAQS